MAIHSAWEWIETSPACPFDEPERNHDDSGQFPPALLSHFKHFYQKHVCQYWRCEFPNLPSYQRFVEWMPSTLIPLCVYLKHCFGQCSGISFINATALKVCHNRRINSHPVFEDIAARGKTSVDWFFGFKLHLVVNEFGELLNMTVTPGNVDGRKPVTELLRTLFGKVFADRATSHSSWRVNF